MADAMVVARMPQEKKDSVARKFAELGTNASSAINQLYDYVEVHGCLPFDGERGEPSLEARKAAALRWIGALEQLPQDNRFRELSDEQIRALRLSSKGFDAEVER